MLAGQDVFETPNAKNGVPGFILPPPNLLTSVDVWSVWILKWEIPALLGCVCWRFKPRTELSGSLGLEELREVLDPSQRPSMALRKRPL